MPAQTREEFIERWEDYINQITKLGNSTNKPETWEEIKAIREDARRLVHKVADETFEVEEPN